MTTRLIALVAASLAAASPATFAQNAPGSVEFQRRQFEPRLAPRAEPEAARPAEAPQPPAASAEGDFILRGVVVEGATAINPAALADIWEPLIGAPVTLAALEQIAAAVSARYRAQGFILSQAVLPAQTVEDGVVRIQVVEGFVDQVGVQGGAPSAQAAARRFLAPVAADRPLRLTTLERGVLLTRDALGSDAGTVLQPSATTFGGADLTATLGDRQVDGFLAVDNRGSRLYGGVIVTAGATSYDAIGLAERLDALVAVAPNDDYLAFGQLGASVPAPFFDGSVLDGSRIEAQVDYSRGEPDFDRVGVPGFTSLEQETNVTAGLYTPFIRTRSENLTGRLNLTWRESTSGAKFDGVSVGSSRDELLVAEGRLTWDRADRLNGVTLVDVGIRQGVDYGGGVVDGSGKAQGEPDFTLGQASLIRLQRFGDSDWSLYGEATGQLAASVLPNSERFSLGGEALGRGFAPGNTTGDSGYGARLEVRRDFDADYLRAGILGGQLYAFGDYGQARDRTAERDGDRWEELGSVGLGLRVDVSESVTLTPEIAVQVAGRPSDRTNPNRETRFFLSAVARF